MPLTPEEERQLEYLLRKKYGEPAVPEAGQPEGDLAAVTHAQPAEGSAKVHGDKLDTERDK